MARDHSENIDDYCRDNYGHTNWGYLDTYTKEELKKAEHDIENNIVSKYLKMFGLSKLKQVVYIMRTSEDQYPRNKYLNWDDYIKTKNGYDNYFYICSNTIEELEYQINQQASEQKG